jgi:Asp-tRNA(Asn)/Glu-tRNA(Gln) amidotransferase A subunit family amidase
VTPAAYCGIVGFKPSYQRIPLDGVIPFSPSMDHGGILTTDVATAQLAASVVCDDWDEDPPPPELVLGCPAADYTHRAKSRAVAASDDVIELLRRDGLAVVATSTLTDVEAITIAHRRLVAAEFARVHADWFSQYGDRYRRRTAGLYAEGAALAESAIAEGRESGRTLMRSVDEIMRREGIAAFVSPSTTDVAPLGLDYIGDPIMGVPWTHAHLPVVTLPIVSSPETLPLGIQLTGRPGRDEQLLGLAGLIEAVLRAEGLWPT